MNGKSRLASYVPKGKEKQAMLTPSCNVPFEPF